MDKKSKKKKGNRDKTIILIPFLLILIVILVVVFIPGGKKTTYQIKKRVDKVKTTTIVDDGFTYQTVGWLQVQGTNIDYPIIFHEEEANYPAYLDHYVWLSNLEAKYQSHMILYGHNIFNLSSKPQLENENFRRFEELMSFVYYPFAKDNQYIQLTFDGKEYVYKVFAVGFIPLSETLFFPGTYQYTKEELMDYVDTIEKYNIYDYAVDVDKEDSIISLVTCTRFFGANQEYEFRVLGRLVRDGEKYDSYSVKKSKNYQKVEEILKGDDRNEDDI